MRKLLLATAFLALGTSVGLAQQQSSVSLALSPQDWAVVMSALEERPFKEVASTVARITVAAQRNQAVSTGENKPVAAPKPKDPPKVDPAPAPINPEKSDKPEDHKTP